LTFASSWVHPGIFCGSVLILYLDLFALFMSLSTFCFVYLSSVSCVQYWLRFSIAYSWFALLFFLTSILIVKRTIVFLFLVQVLWRPLKRWPNTLYIKQLFLKVYNLTFRFVSRIWLQMCLENALSVEKNNRNNCSYQSYSTKEIYQLPLPLAN